MDALELHHTDWVAALIAKSSSNDWELLEVARSFLHPLPPVPLTHWASGCRSGSKRAAHCRRGTQGDPLEPLPVDTLLSTGIECR